MRWLRALITVCVAACSFAMAQPVGEVREGLTLPSQVFKKNMRYSIYLPPGYELTKRTYPVLYLLHGFTDDDTAWIQYGEISRTIDEAIASRQVVPMIVVMPDGGVSWYVNNFDGSVRWEDYFIKDLIPYVEGHFRVRPTRISRAVAGLSMGGHGALLNAMHHPDLFATCAALSPAIYTDQTIITMTEERWNEKDLVPYGPDPKGAARLTPHRQSNNPLKLAATLPVDTLNQVRYYIDCGDEDELLNGAIALHLTMTERGIPHAFRVRGGGHVWSYWRSGLIPMLSFISETFHRP